MKIRSGFVTNSSSSSYIIGFKDIKKMSCWDDLPEFAKKIVTKYIDMAVNNAEIINTIEELDKKFISNYGYDTLEELLKDEDDWYVNYYNKSKEAIENGYSIADVDVDYNDDTGNSFYESLPRTDDGTGFFLIEKGY